MFSHHILHVKQLRPTEATELFWVLGHMSGLKLPNLQSQTISMAHNYLQTGNTGPAPENAPHPQSLTTDKTEIVHSHPRDLGYHCWDSLSSQTCWVPKNLSPGRRIKGQISRDLVPYLLGQASNHGCFQIQEMRGGGKGPKFLKNVVAQFCTLWVARLLS